MSFSDILNIGTNQCTNGAFLAIADAFEQGPVDGATREFIDQVAQLRIQRVVNAYGEKFVKGMIGRYVALARAKGIDVPEVLTPRVKYHALVTEAQNLYAPLLPEGNYPLFRTQVLTQLARAFSAQNKQKESDTKKGQIQADDNDRIRISRESRTDISVRGVASPLTITELVIEGLGLTIFPEIILTMTQLESLSLSGNRLQALPELDALQNLRCLQCACNELLALPEALPSELATLQVANNGLTELPDSISTLAQLNLLDVASNGLTGLPDLTLTKLESAFIAGNPWSDQFIARLQAAAQGANITPVLLTRGRNLQKSNPALYLMYSVDETSGSVVRAATQIQVNPIPLPGSFFGTILSRLMGGTSRGTPAAVVTV